jgi:Fe-S cluster biogenesis protein NfuA
MATVQDIPVTIYAEMTPNPNTIKFVANKMLVEDDVVVEYTTAASTKGSSELAEALFNFPFVTNVFITRNFITVTKPNQFDWNDISYELRLFIADFLKNTLQVVTKLPETDNKEELSSSFKDASSTYETIITSEVDQQIVDLLEEYVRPAVENDGGAIHFKSYTEGVVTVILKGSCSGCPSSTQTLKGGVEQLLKSHIKEVTEVVAEAH